MGRVIDFPDCEAIEDEALIWLIRLDGDRPLNASEEREFDQWLARSPVHREALKSLNAFWGDCNVLGELVQPPSVINLCKQHIQAYLKPLSEFRMATAATLAMTLALGLVVIGLNSGGDITRSNGLYLTAVGQQKTITLADKSSIQLNTNSQIQVDFSEGYRNIRLLQGEVHFEVAKDPSKPFRVYAGSGRVEAIGTAFNVYLKDTDVDVFVTEGRVGLASILPLSSSARDRLQDAGSSLRPSQNQSDSTALTMALETRDSYAQSDINGLGDMSAGQGMTLRKTQATLTLSGENNKLSETQPVVELVPLDIGDSQQQKAHLAWRKGLLVFSGESLAEAITEIERYTTVSIEIIDPELRNIKIGGQIQVGDTDSMFRALEASFGLKVKRLSYNRVQVMAEL